jgi:hypothetical protein
MPNIDTIRNSLVNEYYDNSVMLNVAMNIETFLSDDVILYPYTNWGKGEVIGGPYLKRYFATVILRYDYIDMPDPEGALVLKGFGVNVKYKKVKEKVLDTEKSEKSNEKVFKYEPAWFIQLDIPRDLVTDERQRQQMASIEHLLDLEALEDITDDNAEDGDFGGDDFGGDDFDADFEDTDVGGSSPEVDEPMGDEDET